MFRLGISSGCQEGTLGYGATSMYRGDLVPRRPADGWKRGEQFLLTFHTFPGLEGWVLRSPRLEVCFILKPKLSFARWQAVVQFFQPWLTVHYAARNPRINPQMSPNCRIGIQKPLDLNGVSRMRSYLYRHRDERGAFVYSTKTIWIDCGGSSFEVSLIKSWLQ